MIRFVRVLQLHQVFSHHGADVVLLQSSNKYEREAVLDVAGGEENVIGPAYWKHGVGVIPHQGLFKALLEFYDTALKEIWYNDNFTWSTTGSGGFDIQTVALHENGHALELGHFGKIFRTKNGKLHFAPKALMNASYSGVQRSLRGTDNAAYCGNFASWPH